MSKTLVVWSAVALLLCVSIVCIPQEEEKIPLHEPIFIESDEGFTAANGVRDGSGTVDDPFVIEKLWIDASESGYGIRISQVESYFTLREVHVQTASKAGVELVEVPNSSVEQCVFESCKVGLTLSLCSSLSVRANNFEDCGGIGLALKESKNNLIADNSFVGRGSGVCVYEGSTGNAIARNTFDDLALFSLYLGSGGNWIYHNNFNRAIVRDDGYNVWQKEGEGNYWGKSYRGEDSNQDGIGDEPQPVSGEGYNYDNCPLIDPWKP